MRTLRISPAKQRQARASKAVSEPGSRQSWWWDECPTHGKTAHIEAIGGVCCMCQDERLKTPYGVGVW